MSAAGAITLADLYPSWVAAFVALAVLLSISRVYLRVHYVFDVLAGLALGASSASPSSSSCRRREPGQAVE